MLFCKNYLLGNGSQTKNVASFDMLRYMLFKACTAQNKRNHSTIVNRCSGVDEDTVLCRKLIEFLSQSTAQMRSTDVAAQHFSGAEDTVQWHKLTRLLRGVAQDGREIIVFLEYRGRTWVSFSRSYRHLTTPHNSTVGRESRFVFSKLFARG